MVQLRSCYFCGTTGELSEYAALPPVLRVDETSTPRVVLCDRCHTKLANVLAPLADSVGREGAGALDDAAGQSSAVRPGPQGDDDQGDATAETASAAADTSSSQPEVTFSEPVAESAATEPADGESTATSADEAPAADEDGGSDANENESPDTDSSDADAVDEEEGGPAADTAPPATDLDRVYHKLLRFLRNREFPVPRAEAEAIAQSAYDLTATEASQVIQRTVDRDVLEERDGELHRR